MNKLSWMLLMIPLISITTDAVYTQDEISNIVTRLVMRFRFFPRQGDRQYAVLMVLPAGHNVVLNPNQRRVMRNRVNADVLLGTNYVVSRTHFGQHTETQLLSHLPTLLSNYRTAFRADPPAVLLYTRGTPCSGCTEAIDRTRYNVFRQGQFVVAYSTNMVNEYMNPTLNCQNRNTLRRYSGINVYCVSERGRNQCREDDTIPCFQHDQLYGYRPNNHGTGNGRNNRE